MTWETTISLFIHPFYPTKSSPYKKKPIENDRLWALLMLIWFEARWNSESSLGGIKIVAT